MKSRQIQTLKDLEIIAINDGSTDKSLKVLLFRNFNKGNQNLE